MSLCCTLAPRDQHSWGLRIRSLGASGSASTFACKQGVWLFLGQQQQQHQKVGGSVWVSSSSTTTRCVALFGSAAAAPPQGVWLCLGQQQQQQGMALPFGETMPSNAVPAGGGAACCTLCFCVPMRCLSFPCNRRPEAQSRRQQRRHHRSLHLCRRYAGLGRACKEEQGGGHGLSPGTLGLLWGPSGRLLCTLLLLCPAPGAWKRASGRMG